MPTTRKTTTARKTTSPRSRKATPKPTEPAEEYYDENGNLTAVATPLRPRATRDRLPKRTKERAAETVTFDVDGWDAPFTVPSMKSLSVGVQRKLTKGDLNPLVEALGAYADIVDDMDSDEVAEFMEAWAEASGVDMGKSQAASS